ncbi:MAG: helix-turn-helix domain-containing protein [Chthoniobacterales bacterium]
MYITAGTSKRILHEFRREPNFPFWALSSCSSGNYTLFDNQGGHYDHDPLSFFLTEPNTPYELTSTVPLSGLRWAFFIPPPNLVPLLNWPEEVRGRHLLRITNPSLWKQMYQAVGHLSKCFSAIHPHREVLAMNALEYVLLLAQPIIEGGAHGIPHDPRILTALESIRKSPAKNWSIKELAKLVNMSETSLRHRFTEEVGVSPIHYAETQRMEFAKSILMQSNETIGEIAEQLGYANPYHFSNRFRKMVGKSPRAFRRDPAAGMPAPRA